ncbi:hypothetical protein FACS1894188_12210 [Clostridia bacterium]|nr:hypothetical protein FACS1894188_12210 [Clostridia bacterium]
MKKVIKFLLFIIFAVLLKENALADELNLYYMLPDEEKFRIRQENIDAKDIKKIFKLYEIIFSDKDLYFIPQNVKIYNVRVDGETLVLDVSEDIFSFSGAYGETRLTSILVKNALQFDGVNKVTISSNGEIAVFPEGTVIANTSAACYND